MKHNLNNLKMTVYAVILIGVFTGIIVASASSNTGIEAEGDADTRVASDPSASNGEYTSGGSESFTPPFSGDAVLHIFTPASTNETIGKWDVYEINLTTTNNYSNPYKDVSLTAIFNGPDGKEIIIESFWDGGDTWKVRMAPTEVGTWIYTTTSNDNQLNGITGSFKCVESGKKGFIRVDPSHPHHFIYDDGTPFLMKMCAMTVHAGAKGGGIFSYGGWMSDGSFQTYIDTRASQGFNAMHWGMLFAKWGLGGGQENEGGQPFQDMDLRNPINPAYFQWADKRVEYALSKGIIPQFGIVWPDTQPSGGSHENYKRLWRYVIARYSAYQVTWNLFGEGNEWGTDSIPREYGLLTKQYDPYDHPVTYHTTRDGNKGNAWLDFVDLQDSTSAVSSNLHYNKPVVNAEYGGYDDAPYPHGTDADTIRKMVWGIRIRGGYPVYETWGSDLTTPAVEYVSKMWYFFDDKEFWLLEPHHELVNASLALANPGHEYVVYLPNGGSVSVDLSDAGGTLNVEWYNPRNGTYYDKGTVAGGGNESFTSPFSGDAVLHIVAIVFDSGGGTYPSISGTHTGTIKPTDDIAVEKMYTYPCPVTGGHSEYVQIWNASGTIAEENWSGYEGDWHTISFDNPFILKANETYNYTIRTGSYPQIIHKPRANVTGGTITCEEFVAANGKSYNDWIPAIKLYSAGAASTSSSISDDMVHAGGDIEPPATVLYNTNNSALEGAFEALKRCLNTMQKIQKLFMS